MSHYPTEEWQPIKKAVIAFLQDHPSYAPMLLNTGQQQGKWTVIGYEQSITSGHIRLNISLEYEGQTYTSSWHMADKRERAKQLAQVDMLATIAGEENVTPAISATGSQESLSNGEQDT